MTDLADRLERLGLSQYLDAFITEGFDTWETVLDITESDLTVLNVKLGHRRKLQRAIAEARGQPPDRALSLEARKQTAGEGAYRSDDSGAEPREASASASVGNAPGAAAANPGQKRKYRRHPKPDPHAPERPPSAYVIFSNNVREELKGQELSFTEIAKVVGERWQVLPTEIRETCEQQANAAKEKYYSELAEYKKTPEYNQYQEYLMEFKAKHGPTRQQEGKRPKHESESSSVSLPMSHPEGVERPSLPGGSKSAPTVSVGHNLASSSSPPGAGGYHSSFRRLSSSSSPALFSEAVNSPKKVGPYSPGASSPSSSATFTPKDPRAQARQRELPVQHYSSHPQPGFPTFRTAEPWPEGIPQQPPYIPGALVRRESRESAINPPPLTHTDSTVSSHDGGQPLPLPSSLLPLRDAKSYQLTLPKPVLAPGSRHSPLDMRPTALAPPNTLPPLGPGATAPHDHRTASNWRALLGATDLAREADMRQDEDRREADDEPP